MRANTTIACVTVFLSVGSVGMAHAQTVESRGFEPVDQAIGDIDPLARSLRRAEPGIGQQGGQESHVFRRAGQGPGGKLYYMAPGITASYDRSDYGWFEVQKDDFRLFQLIPPNTVFHLGAPSTPEDEHPPRRLNPLRLDARVRAQLSATPRPPTPSRLVTDVEERWRSYKASQRHQRTLVVEAIKAFDSKENEESPTKPEPPKVRKRDALQ